MLGDYYLSKIKDPLTISSVSHSIFPTQITSRKRPSFTMKTEELTCFFFHFLFLLAHEVLDINVFKKLSCSIMLFQKPFRLQGVVFNTVEVLECLECLNGLTGNQTNACKLAKFRKHLMATKCLTSQTYAV